MDSEIVKRMDNLPESVRLCSLDNKAIMATVSIWKKYLDHDENKLEQFKDIKGLTFLKELKIEDLPLELKKEFGFDDAKAKEVALIVFCEMLYPIKDFFPGLDDAIISLGGELPKEEPKIFGEQFLVREKEIEEMQRRKEAEEEEKKKDLIISDFIEELMHKYPESGEMMIGSQKAIAVKGLDVEMKPMIKYWIQDYMEKTGYYRHDNLDRLQYVCHDKNTRSMNDEERRQLNLVLKSVDKEIKLPFSTRRKKIDFSLVPEEE
jgi:hypothetical protein